MDLPIFPGEPVPSEKILEAKSQRVRFRSDENRIAPSIEIKDLDQVWFQVAGTRCNLECSHCFISCSPKNTSFGFLTLEYIENYLAQAQTLGVSEFYFTGGEPFLNPQMTSILVRTLDFGAATVLTNGTVFKNQWLSQLRSAELSSRYSLEFRVSIDGFDAATNDPIRGEGTFQRAFAGLRQLVKFGFLPIITAVRTWADDEDQKVIGKFSELLETIGYSRPRIKLLPTLNMGAEEDRTSGYSDTQRVTHEMMNGFDGTQLVCHNSRLVSDRGVHVCPILLESPDSLMGESLNASLRPFELKHGACFTCYQFGAICSNPSGGINQSKSKTPKAPEKRKG